MLPYPALEDTMSSTMNDKDLEQFKAHVTKLAKGLKSEADLGDLTQQLMKMTVEAALGAELDDHLGYDKHDPVGRGSGNSRNGTTPKRLKGGSTARSRLMRHATGQAPLSRSSCARARLA